MTNVKSITIDPDDESPWLRQKGESEVAHGNFQAYRDMERQPTSNSRTPTRSLRRLAETLGLTTSALAQQSRRYRWADRALSWDRYLEHLLAEEMSQTIVEMNKRHANEAVLLQQRALEALQNLDPASIPPSVIVRMLEAAVGIERVARGQASEIVAHQGGAEPIRVETVIDPKMLSPEQAVILLEAKRALDESRRKTGRTALAVVASAG